jgi:hypothetical protein
VPAVRAMLLIAGWAAQASAQPLGEDEPGVDVGAPGETSVEPEGLPSSADAGIEAPTPAAPVASPRHSKCVPDDAYERYAQVKAAAHDPDAFRPSALWLPPFFMTDAERSYTWAALLYFDFFGLDDGSRTTLLPPFFARSCTEESETLLTPLFGWRTDAEGTARLLLTYFQRRDRLAESDVFFPLVWWLRTRPDESSEWSEAGSVFPLAWWKRTPAGKHYTLVLPFFYRWGDAEESTSVAANVFWSSRPSGSSLGVVPLFFRSTDGPRHRLIIPPLLTVHSGDGETESTWALNTWYQSRPGGFTLASVPFVFAGREGDTHHEIIPPLLWRWGDAEETTTIVAAGYFHQATDGVDFGLAPLYFGGRSTVDGAYDVSPFLFWSFRRPHQHTLVLPPLLTLHTGDDQGTESTWAFNTWYQSRPNGFTFAAAPFVFAGREGEAHHEVVPPLFWRWGDAEETTTIVAAGYFHRAADGVDFGLAPLYFGGRSAEQNYDVSPLLFWSYRRAQRSTLLLPALLTFHQQDDEQHESTTVVGPGYFRRAADGYDAGLAPLYFGGRSTERGDYDVSPLLFWSLRHGDRQTLVLPLLLAARWGDSSEEHLWWLNTYYRASLTGFTLTSVPFFFAGREGEEHHEFVPPLFWRWGDATGTTTVFANGWWRDDVDGSSAGVVPFYFRGRSTVEGDYDVSPLLFWSFRHGASRSLLIPPALLWHHEDELGETTVVANSYWERRTLGWTYNVIPFFFSGAEGDDHHFFAPPLFWNWGDAQRNNTIAALGWLYEADHRADYGIFPLYFGGRSDEGDAYDVSPALFLSVRSHARHLLFLPALATLHYGEGTTESTWAINTWYQSRPSGFTLASLPFLFAGREGDSHYEMFLPFFERWGNTAESTTIVGTAYVHDAPERKDFGVAPLYFGGRTVGREYDVSPALFWSFREPDRNTLVMPALLTYLRSTPERSDLGVMPLYFHGSGSDGAYDISPPLFWSLREPGRNTLVVPPLLTYFRSTEERSDLAVMPLYFHGLGTDGAYDVSPPLFWSFREPGRKTLVMPPLLTYFRSTEERSDLGVMPLYFHGSGSDGAYDISPPLFWSLREPGRNTLVMPPLLTYFRSTEERSDLGVMPLYFHGSGSDGAYDVSPPLFWSLREPGRNTLVMPPLLTYFRSTEERSDLGVMPFYFHGRSQDGDGYDVIPPLLSGYSSRPNGYSLAALGLLYSGRDGDEHHTVVPPLVWHFGDAETETTVVGPAFYRSTPTQKTFGLAPLYFAGRGEKSFDLVPPLFYRRADSGSEHLMLLPLFDYRRDDDGKLFLSPVAVYSKSALREATVVGGLYWHIDGPATDATVLAPVWWDFKSKKSGTRLSTVFPVYWRYETPEERTHVFLNVVFSEGHTDRGRSWAFHLFPLFDVASYHPEHLLWQVFGGLVGHEAQSGSERWRVGWAWTQSPRPTPTVAPTPKAQEL